MAAAKKDLVTWCKGKEGVEHTREVTILPTRRLGKIGTCGKVGTKYRCVHVEWCSTCKRVLTYEWQMTEDMCTR